ncbi:hypothetical protein ACERNI_15750 [Camelimonas sp. ID_303_24]
MTPATQIGAVQAEEVVRSRSSPELIAANGGAKAKGEVARSGDEPLDTEHLFGFAEGSDIGQPGELELETEATGRFGKRHGSFSAIDAAISLKAPVTRSFRLSPGFIVSRYDIHGMPDQVDRHRTALDGAFLDMRFRVLDRAVAPVGLTLGVTPGFGGVEPGTGLRSREYGASFKVLIDREIIPGQLIAALNLDYDMGVSRPHASGVGHGSGVGVTAALSWRLRPDVFVGAEAHYARAYEGLGLDRYAGQALFVGPTLYVAFGSHLWASVAWRAQLAGDARHHAGHFDLDQFERHQVRLRVGGHF